MYIPYFLNSFTSWWILELPSPLISGNNSIMNMCIQGSAWVSVFTFGEYILWNGIDGSYSKSTFNFLTSCQMNTGCLVLLPLENVPATWLKPGCPFSFPFDPQFLGTSAGRLGESTQGPVLIQISQWPNNLRCKFYELLERNFKTAKQEYF